MEAGCQTSAHSSPPPHQGLEIDLNSSWTYERKNILAPMVRAGTLPLRVLARKFGADIVYSEEIIDHSIIASERVENKEDGTIDFLPKKQVISKKQRRRKQQQAPENISKFRTYRGEPIVFQMGTNDAVRALKASQIVAGDVRAIDVNMGCPKHFSVHAGMGAGLLSSPETIQDILRTLVRNLSIPVTCKIRLKESEKDTIELLKVIEGCGVAAIGIHARCVYDRPRHRALVEKIRPLVSSINVPVIYNGDVFHFSDFKRQMREETGSASVMTARGGLWNCSLFRPEGSRLALKAKDIDALDKALDACLSEESIADAKHYKLGVKFVRRKDDVDGISRNRKKHLRSLEEGMKKLAEARLKRSHQESIECDKAGVTRGEEENGSTLSVVENNMGKKRRT